jgi:hypothetical protein
LEDIKWAIVATRKLKIKEGVSDTSLDAILLIRQLQDIHLLTPKQRIRIEIKAPAEEKFYQLKSLKRVLPGVIVKVLRIDRV